MTFTWLNFMKPSRVERHRFVMWIHVPLSSQTLPFLRVVSKEVPSSSSPDSTSIESPKSDSMVSFPTMFCMSRCRPIRGFSKTAMEVQSSMWKAMSHETVDCDACFFHRGSLRHVRSIASQSIKAQGAVPLICSCSDGTLSTPPCPLWRPLIKQGHQALFGRRLHDSFACGRKLGHFC